MNMQRGAIRGDCLWNRGIEIQAEIFSPEAGVGPFYWRGDLVTKSLFLGEVYF